MDIINTCFPKMLCNDCGTEHYNLTDEEEDNLWNITDGGELTAQIMTILHDNSNRKRCLFDAVNRNDPSLKYRLDKKVETFTHLERTFIVLQKDHVDLKASFDQLRKATMERVIVYERRTRALLEEKKALEARSTQLELGIATFKSLGLSVMKARGHGDI
ncbi:hypothetical protein BU16DRAFT_566330 [Lophium mytilinum]|uniref:Uncharacterized protein n=1 Tax=Lophium mytilinum TaxID=390894 RepID=A0A6A6QCY9_9PEZI|nr:hypothetical protein BU16DRAFT_566330 [Lophium mytilinum]